MSKATRRDTLKLIAVAGASVTTTAACAKPQGQQSKPTPAKASTMPSTDPTQPASKRSPAAAGADAIISVSPLAFPWQTVDPFLFCVHHDDRYPAGNERMGPLASLDGRNMGQDFEGKDGWRMYLSLILI